MRWISAGLVPVAAIIAPQLAHATVYLTTEQAQQAIFPGEKLTQTPVMLTDAQKAQMRERSGVREPFKGDRVWRTSAGGWFIIDQVVGKHEMITYAAGINHDGSVKHIEILQYNETYGFEVREASWRSQFEGKTLASPLKLNQDIKNVSGATLSCKHVTDGVKRLLVLHDIVLKGLA